MSTLGTMIFDATCSPSNIRYSQDPSLLNEAPENLDAMIYKLHDSRSQKRTDKQNRAIVYSMHNAVKQMLGFINDLMSKDGTLNKKNTELLARIRNLYNQQKEMFYEHKHRIENCIESIARPFVRPLVRGKTKARIEFGAMYDVSINECGHARLEKITFDPYNEVSILRDVIELYRERTGHYPAHVLVDKIYCTKANKAFCNEHRIKMLGRKIGRPSKDNNERLKLEKLERKNDTDRIEVGRFFSLEKRCRGIRLIMTKLSETTLDEYCAFRACLSTYSG